MSDWIYLSKGGQDPYINQFALAQRTPVVNSDDFFVDPTDHRPILLRGILKKTIIKKCWDYNRTFYYMDTGYFGNEVTPSNPNGWKYWHRIVKNDLQHHDLVERPDDRLRLFKHLRLKEWKKGRNILLACPDEKPMKFYGLDLEQWIEETVNEIKKHTDRPIIIRRRDKQRAVRLTNTLQEALNEDVHALVTFNSNAGVESIFEGVPVFYLSPTHAVSPVASNDISKIETPYYPSMDKRHAWFKHLSYSQFHVDEFRSGRAKRMLEQP
mgnify:CR=1 FL=1